MTTEGASRETRSRPDPVRWTARVEHDRWRAAAESGPVDNGLQAVWGYSEHPAVTDLMGQLVPGCELRR